jgi:inhibitor of KinA sporulation pathway (predicted exonuclease)
MNFLSLDLELNQPTESIIQVGAAVFDIFSGEIKETIRVYVSLPSSEELSPFITKLTGITKEDLETKGVSLKEAYKNLVNLHTKYSCQKNLITWGGGDSQLLERDLRLLAEDQYAFGRRWIDVKTAHQFYCMRHGISTRGGLAKSLTRVGLRFKGKKHDAMDDAINTALLAHFHAKNV